MKRKTTVSIIIESMNSMSNEEFQSWMITTWEALISLEKQQLFEFYIKGCEDTYGVDDGDVDDDKAEAIRLYHKIFEPCTDFKVK